MRKSTFKELVKVIVSKYVPKMQCDDASAITIEKATLITLWYLAGQSPMESESDRFGVVSLLQYIMNFIVLSIFFVP